MPNTKNLDNFTISLIALSTIKGIGRKKIQTLINEMDNPFQSGYLSYVEKGIEINIFSRMTPISIFLEAREKAYEIMDICDKNHISIASSGESVFPDSLKFEGGPNLIYYQGDLNLLVLVFQQKRDGSFPIGWGNLWVKKKLQLLVG